MGAWLLVALAGVESGVRAQQPKPDAPPAAATKGQNPATKGQAPATKGQAKGAEAEEPATTGVTGIVDTSKGAGDLLEERFEDPKAKPLLANTFPELFATIRGLPGGTDRQIDAMAGGTDPRVDRGLIRTFVQYQLAQLSSHKNLAPMLDPSASTSATRAFDDAAARLMRPIELSVQRKNTEFLKLYTDALQQAAPEALKNHLYVRLTTMVAMTRTRELSLAGLYTQVAQDASQPVAVRMLAAVGLERAAQGGQVDVPADTALGAAAAILKFLDDQKPAFWPAQWRSVQALGALRMAATSAISRKADVADVALGFVADPKANPAVRAWSAWALGMMTPSSQINPYNYRLIAHLVARLCVDIGREIVAVDETRPAESVRLTGLLLQLVAAYDGEAGVRNSGLLKQEHPAVAAQRRELEALATRVRDVTRLAATMTRNLGSVRAEGRKALDDGLDQLEAALGKSEPQDRTLYSQGPEFVRPPAEDAPAEAKAAAPAPTGGSQR